MHASNVIIWDTSERTALSTNVPCVSIGPQATLSYVVHFAVAPPRRPPPLSLPLLSTILLPPNHLVWYLLSEPVNALAARLRISHLIQTWVEDEATILRTLRNAETALDQKPPRKTTMEQQRPTSLDPPEGSTKTTRWSFFSDSDLEGGYCYDLPLVGLSWIYNNFSFHATLSPDSSYASPNVYL